jgi:hypothetical protein
MHTRYLPHTMPPVGPCASSRPPHACRRARSCGLDRAPAADVRAKVVVGLSQITFCSTNFETVQQAWLCSVVWPFEGWSTVGTRTACCARGLSRVPVTACRPHSLGAWSMQPHTFELHRMKLQNAIPASKFISVLMRDWMRVFLCCAVQVVGEGFALCAVSSSERGDVPAMSSKLDKRQKEKVRVLICMVYVCVAICVRASERVVGWCELRGA